MAEPPHTEWGKFEFSQIYEMAHAGDALRMRLAAVGWDQLATMLGRLSHNMIVYRNTVAPMWDSPAGDVFVGKMADFSANASTYAQAATSYANALRDCADAVEVAQKKLNEINGRRQEYLKRKQDLNNLGDVPFVPSVGSIPDYRLVLDVAEDIGANIIGANHVDPNKLREYDDEAIAAMRELAGKYLAAESRMYPLQPYTGPVFYIPQFPQMSAPGMPGAPPVPVPPTMPPIPVVPVLPTTGAPPVVPPVPTGPTLAGGPPVPVGPGPVVLPSPPVAPGVPGVPVAPFLPTNVAKVTPPGMPGPPSPGGPGRTGTPPPPGGRPGVIGKRPGQPGGPGQPGRSGKNGTPPPAGNRNNRRGVIGGKPAVPDPQGRTGTPPPAGQRRGVIGKRPGVDDPTSGRPGSKGGTPPPAGRQRGRGTGQPGSPAEPHGTGPAAGRAARGTPPPTIGNTSRPQRPTGLDHRVLGRSTGSGPAQPDEPTTRRPGIAARKEAAPPVLRGSESDVGQWTEERVRARHSVVDPSEGELGIVEQLAPPPVIESPERTRHGEAERGPAIGGAAG